MPASHAQLGHRPRSRVVGTAQSVLQDIIAQKTTDRAQLTFAPGVHTAIILLLERPHASRVLLAPTTRAQYRRNPPAASSSAPHVRLVTLQTGPDQPLVSHVCLTSCLFMRFAVTAAQKGKLPRCLAHLSVPILL